MANDSFTLSENTNKLLAIYRDFNRVANELWQYFLYHSIATHYADGTPKGAIASLKDFYTKLIEESSSIKSSKFNYLIEEETK